MKHEVLQNAFKSLLDPKDRPGVSVVLVRLPGCWCDIEDGAEDVEWEC